MFPSLSSIKYGPITSWSIKKIYRFTKLKRPGIVLALGSVWPRGLKTSATFTMVPGLGTFPNIRFVCRQNYSCGGKMTADVPDLPSAYCTLKKGKIKSAFIPALQTEVLRFSLTGLSQIPELISVVRGRNVVMDSPEVMSSKPKAGGVEGSNSSDFMHFSQCQGLLGGAREK